MKTIYILFFILNLILLVYIAKEPSVLLKPYNGYLNLRTESKPFYSTSEMYNIFPFAKEIESNFTELKTEGLKFFEDRTENVGSFFLNKEKEFWEGWNTIPVKMFDQMVLKNENKAPILYNLVKNENSVRTAFYSILEPGKKIEKHTGPFGGILRYHLALKVPKIDNIYKGVKLENKCFISVGEQRYTWQEGKSVLFDETYEHYVENNTSDYRVIIFIDVAKPISSPILNSLNELLIKGISESPHNQKVVNSV